MNYDLIYEPDEDSFLIANELKKFHNIKVFDLGSGSGYLAQIALNNNCQVLATDINKKAVDYCKKLGINAIVSDLFSNIHEKFDLIVFNPPYLPLDQEEPKDSSLITTGGKNGNELIQTFLKEAKNYLNNKGKILIVFSSLSGNLIAKFKKLGYKHKKLSEKKLFFEKLYVYMLEPR